MQPISNSASYAIVIRMKRGRHYSADEGVRRRRLPVIIAVIAPLLIIGGLYAFWTLRDGDAEPTPETPQQSVQSGEYTSVEARYLFHGTIAWDRAIERDARGDYARPFSLLSTFDKEKYDAWIADLECPVTDTHVPYQTQVDRLIFNCPPEFIPEAAKWFDIVNLANNHTADLGWENYLETQQRLEDGGIKVFGSPDMSDDENRCEIMAMPVRLQKTGGGEEKTTLPVAFCAYHAVSGSPTQAQIDEISDYSKIMPTIGFMHAGVEYVATNTPQQQQLARAMIDAGADMVIGNHAHWVQNTEVYDGKLIVYATGNFIYDQLEYDEQRSASYDIKLSIPYDETVARWIEYGKECDAAKLNDSCLENVPADIKRPNVTYKYDMVAGDERPPQRWLARKAGDDLQRDTENRTNWLQTLRGLGQDPNARFYND